jgi:ribosomal protein S18 acetylase RimI-like enzyme
VIRVVDPEHPHAQQGIAAYLAELNVRSEVPYDPSKGVSAEPEELRPPRGLMLVAYLEERPVATGALKHHDSGETDIKRMWVDPAARGHGLGRRMLAELEAHAVEHGSVAVRLETNGNLHEAIALYRSAGFVEVEPFNKEPFAHHWFRKEL